MEKIILQKIQDYKTTIEIAIAAIIFIGLYLHGQILVHFTFFAVLSALLSFVILIEVIRMLGQYIVTNHISVTLIVEMVIIFLCRDILLTLSDKSLSLYLKAGYISLFLVILFCFFYFRKKALDYTEIKEAIAYDKENFKPKLNKE